jgi:hypothetical protein
VKTFWQLDKAKAMLNTTAVHGATVFQTVEEMGLISDAELF